MTTRVTFKDETEVNGQPAGPVTVYDVEAYDADPVIAEHKAAGKFGMPFGYEPAGMTRLGWFTLKQAQNIAASHGVKLERT